jgi:hypothetical protein
MKELKKLICAAFCYSYQTDNAYFKTVEVVYTYHQGLYKPKSHSRQKHIAATPANQTQINFLQMSSPLQTQNFQAL